MSPITRTATPAVVLLLAAGAPARAERDPDDRCAAVILRAPGRLANCLLQSDAGFVVSDKAERYEKKVGRCEDGFARRHRRIIGRHGAANCPDDSADELGDIVLRSTASRHRDIAPSRRRPKPAACSTAHTLPRASLHSRRARTRGSRPTPYLAIIS
jgi:hypothetical protein